MVRIARAASDGPVPGPQALPVSGQRNANLPESLLEPLCGSFRKSDYDIAALVRTILSSRHFYSCHAFRQRIKGPVEYVLGAVQSVYRRYAEGEPSTGLCRSRCSLVCSARWGNRFAAPMSRVGRAGRHGWEHGDAARASQLRSSRWRWARCGRPGRRSQAQHRGRLIQFTSNFEAITSGDRAGRGG